MPAADDIPASLQESILAALLFEERSGAAVAAQVKPEMFDESYREIAEKVLTYRRRYKHPPGLAHIDDLFAQRLSSNRAPRLRRVILDLAELSKGLNGDYVVNQTQEFIRQRTVYGALIEANARWEQGGDNLSGDIEGIFSGALKARTVALDAGTFLNDTSRSLKFLDRNVSGISLGIDALKKFNVSLVPKEMMLYIAPKGSGKSWSCIHVGVESLQQRQRVLHITLEMSEEQVAARYYQCAFAAGTRPERFDQTWLTFDRLGRLSGFKTKLVKPTWNFAARDARKELLRRLGPWGARFGRLVIKEFASGSFTIQQLEGFLDYLELEHKFVPTVLIVDYPDLMQQDKRNFRISIGQTYVELRGLLQKRNLAGYFPTQGNRSTLRAKNTRGDAVSEDVSKLFTADKVLSFSRTEDEKRLGLARLMVEYARGVPDGLQIVMTQSYSTGQYILQSALMRDAYWERLRQVTGQTEGD